MATVAPMGWLELELRSVGHAAIVASQPDANQTDTTHPNAWGNADKVRCYQHITSLWKFCAPAAGIYSI